MAGIAPRNRCLGLAGRQQAATSSDLWPGLGYNNGRRGCLQGVPRPFLNRLLGSRWWENHFWIYNKVYGTLLMNYVEDKSGHAR